MNWPYILLSYICLFCFGLIDNARGPTYPEILNLFDLSPAMGAAFFSVSGISALVTTLFYPFWLPRLGSVKGIGFSMLIFSLGSFTIGSGETFPIILCGVFMLGIGGAGMGITMNILVGEGTPEKKRRKYFSGLHSIYGLASFLTPLLLIQSADWRLYFRILAILPGIIFGISFFVKDKTGGDREKIKVQSIPLNIRLKIYSFIGLGVAAEISASSRMVYFVKDKWPLLAHNSTFYLSGFFLCLLVGRLSFAFLNLKTSSMNLLKLSLGLQFVSFLIGVLYHPMGLVISGLTMAIFFPCAMSWLNENYPKRAPGLIASSMTFITFYIMGTHNLIGLLSSYFGIGNALIVGPGLVVASFIVLCSLSEKESPILDV